MRLVIIICFFFLAAPAVAKTRQVTVEWDYQNFPLKIELYEPPANKATEIAYTELFDDIGAARLGSPIEGPVTVGANRAMALVIKNTGKSAVYFYAVPHTVQPAASSLGQLFECLCNGHVYKIGPGKSWVRIARLSYRPNASKIQSLSIKHEIIGLTEAEVKASGRKVYGEKVGEKVGEKS
jgi:hypothetical protein